MRTRRIFLGIGLCLSVWCCMASVYPHTTGKTFQLPAETKGTDRPTISLNGEWRFRYSPETEWNVIQVPGEAAMQGYAIRHDEPFVYKRTFTVPADYAGKRVILRFDGVYSHALLSVNGHPIREHNGGFTRWETDITSWVYPGKENEVELEVTDRLDEISYASGYAHHPIGGILRDVTLFAIPENHIYDAYVETDLDSLYQDAELRFGCRFEGVSDTDIRFTLTDPDGNNVPLKENRKRLEQGENPFSFQIKRPQKWDAEHPFLYTLTVRTYTDGKETASFVRRVGFREVEIKGNRMLVNGKAVKLRGACRHDIHPRLGRTTSAELDSLDALLFKEANMNFVRTSHYPPSERFLDFCDRYGIYVESETAVCFVNTHRQKNYAPGASHDDPEFTDQYLSQCQEMVKSFRSHPSILFWSIGNESTYGSNFQLSRNWIKSTDRTRPVVFSYPGSVPENAKVYDILSMHYQDTEGNLSQWGMSTRHFEGHGIPALFDEWAHPACYTYSTLQTDPNIREFWGQSLDRMWSGLFETTGGLGGAIWGYIDETFALPEPKTGTAFWKEFAHTAKPEGFRGNCVGYGEWGIVDVWRRKKPEFWSTKKAYSPVRILSGTNLDFTPGQDLILPVHNRFDHTMLNEIRANFTYKGTTKEIPLERISPHAKGIITVPGRQWESGEPVQIEFLTPEGKPIDTYRFILGEESIRFPEPLAGGSIQIKETSDKTIVKGEKFEIPFEKATGLITDATTEGNVIIRKGPFLNAYINLNHLSGAEVRKMADHYAVDEKDWQKKSLHFTKKGNTIYVDLQGSYKEVKANFRIRITAGGEISVSYTTDGLPNGYLRETGLAFHLTDDMEQLEWKRKGYWNYYPEGELGGNEGKALLYNSHVPAYGEHPGQPWAMDTHNYYYWADAGAPCAKPLTQIAKGMKENIYHYTLQAGGKKDGHGISVISKDASVACRINKTADGIMRLYTDNRWDYPEIAWGNYCKTLEALPCYGRICLMLR